ncbi:MAG: hypothetical protein OSB00_00950 [Sphingomonas bacterium]|nr:hypothetical protein [Sphingomonas bacterium]
MSFQVRKKGECHSPFSSGSSSAFVAVAVLVEVTGGMSRVVVMLPGYFALALRIAVTVLVQIAGRMSGMIMVLTGHLALPLLVTVAMLIEITGLMAWMIVVLAWFFFCHFTLLPAMQRARRRKAPQHVRQASIARRPRSIGPDMSARLANAGPHGFQTPSVLEFAASDHSG